MWVHTAHRPSVVVDRCALWTHNHHKGDTMHLHCNMDDCPQPPTGVIIIDDTDGGYDVIAHCDGHAPEIMHELIADGNKRDEMVTATLDTYRHGPRTLRDNVGRRVEIASHLDLWMRGDRYGIIVGVHGIKYGVLMDKTGVLQVLTESEVHILPTTTLSDGTVL